MKSSWKVPGRITGDRCLLASLCPSVGIAGVIVTGLAMAPIPAVAASCESLGSIPLSGGTITEAESHAAGSYTAPNGTTYPNLPAFCRVAATLTPTPDSNINIEVWMPSSEWNGRYVGTGNGGYAGSIVYSTLATTLPLGFAVANTDMGTAPATALDGKPLVGHPERWIDWGIRSTHLMTVAAKQIVTAFYDRTPQYSYFTGCSTGGGQALHEAQQFPNDYDGIVGGAPAENRTHVHTEVVWAYNVTHRTPDSLLPADKAQLVTKSVLDACAVESGGLASDPFLTDPRRCNWDPASLQCAGGDAANCLTEGQVQAVKLLYDGPHNPRTGALIYPGIPRGSESGSTFDVPAIEGLSPLFPSTEPLFDGLFYWVFGPDWDWHSFDFDRNVAQVDQILAPSQNANSTDLSQFRAHGGRFLMYHGWADALVPPQDDINYFLRLVNREGESEGHESSALMQAQQFFRLFMAPGMGHCGGGPGPNVFGGANNPGGPPDPQHNVLLALQRWVENGVAPDQVIATKYVNDTPAQGVAMTRPLCPFPKVAGYQGSGDPNDATNFTCAISRSRNNPMPAPEYLAPNLLEAAFQ
jgi:Tannase and feruloyl esterase